MVNKCVVIDGTVYYNYETIPRFYSCQMSTTLCCGVVIIIASE